MDVNDIPLDGKNARLIVFNVYVGDDKNGHISALTEKSSVQRKEHARKYVGIPAGEAINCSVSELVDGLESAGYVLVDAFRRTHPNKPPRKGEYKVARFTFCHPDFVQEHEAQDIGVLRKLCKNFLFRVRLHINPFFEGEDSPVEGFGALSIDLDQRTPRLNPDGTPVLIWPEEKGVGTKVPLEGDCVLYVEGDQLVLA